jgi:hypothetical protein
MPGVAGAERSHDTDISAVLDAGTTLEVRGISGSIVATPALGETATIHAHATSRDGDPATVQVRATRVGHSLVVCPIFPDSDGGDCGSHSRRHRSDDDDRSDVSVDFTVTVPHDVKLVAEAVRGDVVATRLEGDVSARVVEGDVRIVTAGRADARTVSGSIDATLGSASSGDELDFETVNGPIHLTLPHGANASITARTLSGPIDADGGISLAVREHDWVGQSATAKLGTGGAHISLHSVSGSIRVSQS